MLTLQTLKDAQAHVLTLQRLALWFAEQGQTRISTEIQGAAFRASKLRAPKEAPAADPAPAAPIAAVKTAKEKAA